jgi:DNA-binding response OmpR family regulator
MIFTDNSYAIDVSQQKKIAVINNDKDFLDAVKVLLSDYTNHHVVIHHEGKSAYKKIVKEKPDLVILDIRLDKPVTGWKILDLLRLNTDTCGIPVIVCSAALNELKEKEAWLSNHGVLVLPKPFDINDLLALVQKCFTLDKQKLQQREVN